MLPMNMRSEQDLAGMSGTRNRNMRWDVRCARTRAHVQPLAISGVEYECSTPLIIQRADFLGEDVQAETSLVVMQPIFSVSVGGDSWA